VGQGITSLVLWVLLHMFAGKGQKSWQGASIKEGLRHVLCDWFFCSQEKFETANPTTAFYDKFVEHTCDVFNGMNAMILRIVTVQ
jgi:hypothetical protein